MCLFAIGGLNHLLFIPVMLVVSFLIPIGSHMAGRAQVGQRPNAGNENP